MKQRERERERGDVFKVRVFRLGKFFKKQLSFVLAKIQN